MNLGTIMGLLKEADRMRWQNPAIEREDKSPRQYYYIRPYIRQALDPSGKPKRKRIKLGYVDEKLSQRQLEQRKADKMGPINRGTALIEVQIPFQELVDKYLETRVPKLGTITQEKYRGHIKNHILPSFGSSSLGDISRQAIEAWMVKKSEALGWWTLTDLRNILSAIFTAAIDWGLWTHANPCQRVKVGRKTEVREKRIVTADEFQRFILALPDTAILSVDAARLAVLTAATTGLRVSEVFGLEPEHVDPVKHTLRVVQRWCRGDVGPTKSAASKRPVQIGSLANLLFELGRGKHYIFEREPGAPPDDREFQQHVLVPAAKAVGIYFLGFGMHTFRRLNITWRVEVGATPTEAMRAAGHTRADMTLLYTVTDAARDEAVAERILDRLMPKTGAGSVM